MRFVITSAVLLAMFCSTSYAQQQGKAFQIANPQQQQAASDVPNELRYYSNSQTQQLPPSNAPRKSPAVATSQSSTATAQSLNSSDLYATQPTFNVSPTLAPHIDQNTQPAQVSMPILQYVEPNSNQDSGSVQPLMEFPNNSRSQIPAHFTSYANQPNTQPTFAPPAYAESDAECVEPRWYFFGVDPDTCCDEWDGFVDCGGLKANPGHLGRKWLASKDACDRTVRCNQKNGDCGCSSCSNLNGVHSGINFFKSGQGCSSGSSCSTCQSSQPSQVRTALWPTPATNTEDEQLNGILGSMFSTTKNR